VMVVDPVRVEPWQAMGDSGGEKDQRNKRMDGESNARHPHRTSSSQPAHHQAIRSPARRQVNRLLSAE
jgi:hypothetical protein